METTSVVAAVAPMTVEIQLPLPRVTMMNNVSILFIHSLLVVFNGKIYIGIGRSGVK